MLKKILHQGYAASSFASTPIETERANRALIFINWIGGPVTGAAYADGSNIYSISVMGNVLRKDSSITGASVPHFVFFEPPFNTNDGTRHVSWNVAQSGLVTVGQTNLT